MVSLYPRAPESKRLGKPAASTQDLCSRVNRLAEIKAQVRPGFVEKASQALQKRVLSSFEALGRTSPSESLAPVDVSW